jgi:hypothetical protein
MNTTPSKPSAFLLLVLNTPLIAEVVRKYLLHSQVVFFLEEALVLIVGAFVLIKGTGFPRRLPFAFWVSSWLYLAWGLIGEMRSNNPLLIYSIGLGTAVLPLFHLVVSVAYCRDNPSLAIKRYFWCISFWLVAIGIVAIAQIFSGQDGWFSQYGLGEIGNGDYTVDGRGVAGLFRPTSIFMHTGKFGQTIFAFVLFKFCVIFYRRSRPPLVVIMLAIWDIGIIIISGQRSAFLFLTFALATLALLASGRARFKLLSALILGAAISAVVAFALGALKPEVVGIVRDRYLSAFTDIPSRINGNIIIPIGAILDKYPFFGEGVGFYSIGAVRYGAKVIYEYLGEGGAESSWIRTIGEVGFIGFIFYFSSIVNVVLTGLKAMLRSRSSDYKAVGSFLFLWLLSCMLWANTHDVFGNLISMCVGFGLAGCAVTEESDSSGIHADQTNGVYTYTKFRNII